MRLSWNPAIYIWQECGFSHCENVNTIIPINSDRSHYASVKLTTKHYIAVYQAGSLSPYSSHQHMGKGLIHHYTHKVGRQQGKQNTFQHNLFLFIISWAGIITIFLTKTFSPPTLKFFWQTWNNTIKKTFKISWHSHITISGSYYIHSSRHN